VAASDIHALSGAYALDAVDDLERAAFERHLRACDACAQEVRELRETVVRLVDDASTAPPAGLRSAVLQAVARTPQAPPGRAARGSAAAPGRWRRFAAASVAAGVVAAGIGVGTWSVAGQRVREAESVAAAELARTAEIEQILSAPDARLLASPVFGGGTVNIVLAPSLDMAVAVLSGLPSPQAGRVYQLWQIRDGVARSLGVLGSGRTRHTQVMRGIARTDVFGLSVEPTGGSPAPTEVVRLVELG
jgi:anti-sigma-K factor RskA